MYDDEPVEIKPFSLSFDAQDGYMDLRPQVEVVNPKEEPVVVVVPSWEAPPDQPKLPEVPEVKLPEIPETDTQPSVITNQQPVSPPKTPEAEPPVTRRGVKDIIIPNVR